MKGCCNESHCGCSIGPLLGRILVSFIFIFAGIYKIIHFQEYAQMLGQQGMGMVKVLLTISILLEVLGGLSVLLGWFTRTGAILLMITLLPATFLVHSFWNYAGPEYADQLMNFLKNIAIYGGLVLLIAHGPGKWSLDACCCCSHKHPSNKI